MTAPAPSVPGEATAVRPPSCDYEPPQVMDLGRLADLTNGPNYGELGPRPHKVR